MDFFSIGMRRAAAATLGALVLTGCGSAEPARGQPLRVEECKALIRSELARPDTFQFRSAIDDAESRRRQTRIVFAANAPNAPGDHVYVANCEAVCRITDDGQLEPRLAGVMDVNGRDRCLAVPPPPPAGTSAPTNQGG